MTRIDDERIISRDDEMAKAAWSKPFLCKKIYLASHPNIEE
jgi:hypothetical protein